MPNYSLVIGSKFRPLSYQEMLAPVLQQTQAQQEIEQTYAALNVEADKWKKIALEEPNSKAAAQYLKYSDDLKENAARLAFKGLDPNSRQGMYDMSTRYSSEILPIQSAYERKMAEVAEQRKGGNNMKYSYDAGTRSIDEYMDHPSETYKAFDLSLPYKDAATEMANISKVLTDIKHNRIDKYNKMYIEKYGLTPALAARLSDAIKTGKWENMNMNDPAVQFIYRVAQNIYDRYKQDWGKTSDINNEIWNQIARGTSFGLGKDETHAYADFENQLAAKIAATKKEKEEALKNQFRGTALEKKAGDVIMSKENQKIKQKLDRYKEIQKIFKKHPEMFNERKHTVDDLNPGEYYRKPNTYEKVANEQGKKRLKEFDIINNYVDLAKEYKDLEKELVQEINKVNPKANAYSNTKIIEKPISADPLNPKVKVSVPAIVFDNNLAENFDKMVKIENGFNIHLFGPAKKKVMEQLKSNIFTEDSNRSKFVHRRDDPDSMGKKISNIKDFKDKDWDNAYLDVVHGDVRLHIGSDVYLLDPGAFGSEIDEFADGQHMARKDIKKLYKQGDYDKFAEQMEKWAKGLWLWSNSTLPAQQETVSDLTNIIMNFNAGDYNE